jgi:ribonuclease P protein component
MAAQRNKLKRMIREYLRINQKLLPKVNIVIGVRKNINQIEYTEIKKCFYQLIDKFVLLNKQR